MEWAVKLLRHKIIMFRWRPPYDSHDWAMGGGKHHLGLTGGRCGAFAQGFTNHPRGIGWFSYDFNSRRWMWNISLFTIQQEFLLLNIAVDFSAKHANTLRFHNGELVRRHIASGIQIQGVSLDENTPQSIPWIVVLPLRRKHVFFMEFRFLFVHI